VQVTWERRLPVQRKQRGDSTGHVLYELLVVAVDFARS
jgi:hypothetical protein